MRYPTGKTNGLANHATLSEVADLALNHGNVRANLQPEFTDRTLALWYEKQRELSAMLPEFADLALTHGNKREGDVVPQPTMGHAA